MLEGLKRIGLLSHRHELVLSKLGVRLKTPLPLGTLSGTPDLWTPKRANKLRQGFLYLHCLRVESPTIKEARHCQLSRVLNTY